MNCMSFLVGLSFWVSYNSLIWYQNQRYRGIDLIRLVQLKQKFAAHSHYMFEACGSVHVWKMLKYKSIARFTHNHGVWGQLASLCIVGQ
uniref:Uncharacterized protein n=1 Tax=Arundo donax TaxID=35708 RepID=A0A0A9HBV7_ARUDO